MLHAHTHHTYIFSVKMRKFGKRHKTAKENNSHNCETNGMRQDVHISHHELKASFAGNNCFSLYFKTSSNEITAVCSHRKWKTINRFWISIEQKETSLSYLYEQNLARNKRITGNVYANSIMKTDLNKSFYWLKDDFFISYLYFGKFFIPQSNFSARKH